MALGATGKPRCATKLRARTLSPISSIVSGVSRPVGTADDMVMNVTNEAGRTFYRARFTGFTNADAQAACKSLKGEGFKCVTFSTATASAN